MYSREWITLTSIRSNVHIQKQPQGLFYIKRCYWKFRKIHRKTTMSEPVFQFKLQALPTTLTRKKRIRHRFFPLNFAKFLREPFLQKATRRLLLHIQKLIIWMKFEVSKHAQMKGTLIQIRTSICLSSYKNTILKISHSKS